VGGAQTTGRLPVLSEVPERGEVGMHVFDADTGAALRAAA
jgi:hypothetical protein